MDWYQYLDGNVVLEALRQEAVMQWPWLAARRVLGRQQARLSARTRSRFPISPLACHIAYESINSVSHLTLYVETQYRIERV